MKIIYIDVDSLRPDHLGCYGYPRGTSPVIDAFAREAVRFDNLYVSDAPCLPSRTALWSGRFGHRTGVVGHGGTAAQPRVEGKQRGFQDLFYSDGWMTALRRVGHHTVTISSFGERHSAWHWYAGYSEVINPGFQGDDRADQVVPLAIDWIERNAGKQRDFFLHVNLWDPHTPYRTPADFGDHFAGASTPAWLTDDVIARQRASFGPMSAQEPNGYAALDLTSQFPRHPNAIRNLADARRWYDGYDTGVRFADFWIGRLFEALRRAGVYDDALIFLSADHGENLGELNVWGDHQTTDQFTCRAPLIVRFPGAAHAGFVDTGLRYHFDWAATLINLAGGVVPASWDGRSFADRLGTDSHGSSRSAGRECLIMTQGAWSCQRGVRFRDGGKDWLALFTDHAGLKDLDPVMLFDMGSDPYEQVNVAVAEPRLVDRARDFLEAWKADMADATGAADPLLTVIEEGGPFHCKGELVSYLKRLRETGRAHHAERLAARDR